MRFNWQKLDNGSWGVKASGDLGETTNLTGKTVNVTKRDGSVSSARLGSLIDSWNGGRASVYEVVRNGNGAKRQEPKGYLADQPELDDALEARPVPAELRSLTDRECKRLIACISVYVCETDGDAEIIGIENKLREFIGQEPVDLPSYLK